VCVSVCLSARPLSRRILSAGRKSAEKISAVKLNECLFDDLASSTQNNSAIGYVEVTAAAVIAAGYAGTTLSGGR